jgi:26S proteasome regulatory subunit N12
MDLATVQPKFNQLRDAFAKVQEANAGELAVCKDLLQQLKAAVFTFSLSSDTPQLLLARETLEIGVLVSILGADAAAFERYMTQLKPFYQDYADALPKSQKQEAAQGLMLLHLLSSDRIGEFHTELEVIPAAAHGSEYIAKAMELERHMMDGNYRKILDANAVASVPRYCSFFMDQLVETARLKVGTAMEKSYEALPAADAARMLMLSSQADLAAFVDQENALKADKEQAAAEEGGQLASLSFVDEQKAPAEVRWELKDGTLRFQRPPEAKATIPALELVANTIGYATELERIV